MKNVSHKLKQCSDKIFWQNLIIITLLIIFLGLVIYILVRQVNEHYAQMDPMLHRIQNHLAPLDPVVKKVSFYSGNRSYTINKKKVFLCLKDENGEYYDFNMLVYVAIHEIAHVLCNEIGHTRKYYRIFDKLLRKAASLKLYDPSKPIIRNYCGHK